MRKEGAAPGHDSLGRLVVTAGRAPSSPPIAAVELWSPNTRGTVRVLEFLLSDRIRRLQVILHSNQRLTPDRWGSE